MDERKEILKAIAIRRLLEELGVPPKSILIEVESLNTFQNATNTKRLLTKHGFKRYPIGNVCLTHAACFGNIPNNGN